ncbi:hypothetical protein MHU86_8078 [Fragilaria crotonensis]|nr:hypothetical protein MHU86_8078 [Fragilaria crotonensis]
MPHRSTGKTGGDLLRIPAAISYTLLCLHLETPSTAMSAKDATVAFGTGWFGDPVLILPVSFNQSSSICTVLTRVMWYKFSQKNSDPLNEPVLLALVGEDHDHGLEQSWDPQQLLLTA